MTRLLRLVHRIAQQVRARRLERLVDRFLACPDWAAAERPVASRPRLTGDEALGVNLATALRLHAELAEDDTSLRRSVETHGRVGRALTDPSPHAAAVLTNHASALLALARRTGQSAPLDEAISMLRKAVRITVSDAPERAGRLCELGHALISRGREKDTAEAVRAYRESCRLAERDNLPVRLVAGRAWGSWASRRGAHEEAAEAFDHASDALRSLVRTQLTRPAAETWLVRATEVSVEAAHAHTAAGEARQATLRLELGRARLLTAALRREDADIRRLRDTHPELARRFRRAAARVRDMEGGLHDKDRPLLLD